MKSTHIISALFAITIVFSITANAEDHTNAKYANSSATPEKQTVQVVTACDGKKKVIVEGYKEGEPLPQDKAREVAKILSALMDFCEQEITAKLPKTEMSIQLSVNGAPFISVKQVEDFPLVLTHGGTPHSEREKRIWASEVVRLIKKGYETFHDPTLGTNGISCDMCHPDTANTHPETYPKFQTQTKKVAFLRDMINWCIENPMEGQKLADDDPKLRAMEAYITYSRAGKQLEPGKH